MLKTKIYLLFLLLMVMLVGCSNQSGVEEVLFTDAILEPAESHYNTTEVIRGDFVKEATYTASVYYPITRELSFETTGSEALFVEYLVEINEEVEEGTPLANFVNQYDEVALEEKKLKLKRDKESYEAGLKSRKLAIQEAEKVLNKMEENSQKEINKLQLDKLKLEYEKYNDSEVYNLNRKEEELEEYQNSLTVTQLRAPMDGIIANIEKKVEGEVVRPDDLLITMKYSDRTLLKVENGKGNLRYGMEVTIKIGNRNEPIYLKGRVISYSGIVPEDNTDPVVIIEVLDETEDLDWKKNIEVCGELIRMNNVLLVDTYAITFDQQSPYVGILDNGTIHKRYVTVSHSNADYYWILQGLEEGQSLIMK